MIPTLLIALALSAPADIDAAARHLAFHGVVRVERDGDLLFEKGYGMPPTTGFWVASISKSFTAALVLRLVELGRLRLDDPMAGSCPRRRPTRRRITVDQLLTHTSGLPRATYEADGVEDADDAARRILALPLRARGSFSYTNDGYALLAIVVERAGGAPFEELLRREVLAPAGLRSTGSWPDCVRGLPLAPLAKPPTGTRAGANWGFKGGEGVCSTAEESGSVRPGARRRPAALAGLSRPPVGRGRPADVGRGRSRLLLVPCPIGRDGGLDARHGGPRPQWRGEVVPAHPDVDRRPVGRPRAEAGCPGTESSARGRDRGAPAMATTGSATRR